LSLNVNSDNNAANYGRRFNLNANNDPSNVAPMVFYCTQDHGNGMETWNNLYHNLCSLENLEMAYRKASSGKTRRNYVVDFAANLDANLKKLQHELETFAYSPAPLTTFVIRDPKTRKISASHFRDRVIHHALCNIIEPIFAREFIHDSFANQKGKGIHKAIMRFETFMRKTRCASVGGGQRKLSKERELVIVN